MAAASKKDIAALAARLDEAALTVKAITPFSAERPLGLIDAYAIQRQLVVRRVARGERRAGVKMGFTSRVRMAQMGLTDMIWGRLTDAMAVADGGAIPHAGYLKPRVEPELAFLLKQPLAGRVTPLQALSAVEAIAPALEIVDSRFDGAGVSPADIVADNTSGAGFVTGGWHRPDIDFTNLGLVLSFNGKPVQVGSTAAILGDPLRSLVAAARFAEDAGEPLQPGWVIMAGSTTTAEALLPGTWVEMEMQHLGRTGFSVQG